MDRPDMIRAVAETIVTADDGTNMWHARAAARIVDGFLVARTDEAFREAILEAIGQHHSGDRAEGERIATAVVRAIHAQEAAATVKLVAMDNWMAKAWSAWAEAERAKESAALFRAWTRRLLEAAEGIPQVGESGRATKEHRAALANLAALSAAIRQEMIQGDL